MLNEIDLIIGENLTINPKSYLELDYIRDH
jgi:hypothetical protein